MARILSLAVTAHEPEGFTTAPVTAIPLAIETTMDLQIFERSNEQQMG